MAQYSHLRTINFSKNNIPVLQTLTEIPQLLILNASNNRIDVLTFMTYESKLTLLREVDLSNNKIMALPNIQCPKLRKLNLTGNVIEDCYEFKGHPTLETLILNKNKLKNCKGLGNCPRLMELDLSENVITEINDLKDLPALKNLNLKKNEIETLVSPMPDLPRITKLNVEENKVADGKNFEPLKELKSLREFYCLENPLFEEGGDNLKRDLMKSFLPHP
jgi:Leucine-rich repeat (LRR) protein